MITTLIVDDENDIRSLIRLVVETANHGLAVVGEAADGEEALRRWRSDSPVIIVLDNRMPGLTGIDVAKQILSEAPEQRIVLFSAHLDSDTMREARRIGIQRCLDKTQIAGLPDELLSLAPPA